MMLLIAVAFIGLRGSLIRGSIALIFSPLHCHPTLELLGMMLELEVFASNMLVFETLPIYAGIAT